MKAMPEGATAKDRALRLLAVRARSREELRRRLAQVGFGPEEVDSALDDLERVGLVDDAAFASELAAHHLRNRGSGRRAATAALRRAGVDRSTTEAAVEANAPEDEESAATDLALARARRLTALAPEVAYRRLVSFLARRGYDGDTARGAARKAVEVLRSEQDAV